MQWMKYSRARLSVASKLSLDGCSSTHSSSQPRRAGQGYLKLSWSSQCSGCAAKQKRGPSWHDILEKSIRSGLMFATSYLAV